MDIQFDQAKSTEGWVEFCISIHKIILAKALIVCLMIGIKKQTILKGNSIVQSICDPTDNYSPPFIYGTRDQYQPPTNLYSCVPILNQLPYAFEITREVITSLPHYQISFDIELILFGKWAVEGLNGCTRSDYLVLTADQKQYKFTLQDASIDQLACKGITDGGYLIKITNVIEHKASSLVVQLASSTLSDFTMVNFGIRKFAVSSNLCPDERCTACNDQYTCLSCRDNYLVSFDGRKCEQSCPTNYLIKQGRCVQSCGTDSIIDVATKTCIVCDPNCQICQSTTYCSKCYLTYYQFRGQCYSSCPINSIAPSDGSNQCKECSSGCVECNSTGQCSQCEDKHVLISGQCQQCADPHCDKCQNNSQYGCLSCDKGYYFSERKCIPDKCQDDTYRMANQECQVCMGGFYYDLSQHTCIECHSLCHDCVGTSWDECKECSSIRWRYGQSDTAKKDLYSSKLGICDCQNSYEFDTVNNTCQEVGHWYVLSHIMLFIIFFASLQLAYRGKMLYLMNFMYFVQSLSLLGFLNMPYPYFLQDMFTGFNRVNLPSLFPRVFKIDTDRMVLSGREQTVYFSNSPSEIEDIFSFSKLMLYYDRTSNFLLNIPNFLIIAIIPLSAYISLRVYEKVKGKKYKYERTIRNEFIPFFLYHSLVDIFFYVILQFEHASTNSAAHVVGTIGSVITLIALIVIAYFHTYSLLRSVIAFRKKEKDHNIFRFSIYLRDINFISGNIFQQNFRTIQAIKQFILVCCIVGAYNNSVTQAILVLVFQFLYYMILIVVRPFASDANNKQQILYETLLFFCVFLGCWYEFSFGIEGQNIKQFVGVALILGIFILLISMMSVTLVTFYKIEKPIFKEYMAKRHLINQEKERQKMAIQKKKNSITEFAKNDSISQDKNNEISDSDSEKSGGISQQMANQNNNNKGKFQTPKHVLPNGLKSTKNQIPSNNQNEYFGKNHEDTLNVQLGPDYREINKEDFPPYNNQILLSEVPPISALNGAQSRRNPYAQNNQSMSYFLNETDQNIITETYVRQQQNENPNILSVLDDEINQNLDNQSIVRLSERQQDNNDRLYSIASSKQYNIVNENNNKQELDHVYNPSYNLNQPYQSSAKNFNDKPFVSQSIKSDFYDKKSYDRENSSKNMHPNDISSFQNKTTRIEQEAVLQQNSSNHSIILQRNENYHPLKNDTQSFGQADNKSVTIYNEEDDYNKTFMISQNAIQNITDHHLNQFVNKQDPLKNYISRTDTLNIQTDQPNRAKKGVNNQSLVNDYSLSNIDAQSVRIKTQNDQRNSMHQDNSLAEINYRNLNESQQLENSVVAAAHNNFTSNANLNMNNNMNSQSMLNDSILNQSIDPIRGNNQSQSILNSSGIKKIQKKEVKGVFQQTGKQLTNLERSSQKQEIVKAFKESPTKPPQKFATKKKKTLQSSKIAPQQQQQVQNKPPEGNGLDQFHNQTNQYIKKALDTELMYKWKDQSYNYDDDEEY